MSRFSKIFLISLALLLGVIFYFDHARTVLAKVLAANETVCDIDADCPSGEKCVDSVCEQETICDADSDCSSGEKCVDSVCEQETVCDADSDCSSGQKCVDNVCETPGGGTGGGGGGTPTTTKASGLVPCGRKTGTAEEVRPCTVCDIFALASRVMNFFLFTVVPAIAVLFYLIGGLMILLSGAKPNLIATGKNFFWNTTIGLFIIFGAWMITNTVLKSLVGDSDISNNWYKIECTTTEAGVVIPSPTLSPPVGGAVGGDCSLAPLSPITDPAALAIENGAKVVWTSSDSNVQKNLTKLQQEFNKLQNLMVSKVGGSATANSAYRPLAYQMHLFDIFQASQVYSGNQAFYDGISACSSVISALKAEQQKHGVCSGSGPCLVASPNKCAPHVKGTGIDISISPTAFLNTINTFLQNNNIDLRWQALASDPVHFNLINPPFTGCAP